MKLPRRRFLHLAASAAALPAVSRNASAQTYPSRPVHLLSGYAAGGPNDIVARLMSQWLSEHLGQPFIIVSSAGGRSNTAAEAVARATPDSSTRAARQGHRLHPHCGWRLHASLRRECPLLALFDRREGSPIWSLLG
jgi:tripartite-type tricarboxylate transporter receptor subunit TctC